MSEHREEQEFRFIPVSGGNSSIIDADDYPLTIGHNWCLTNGYVSCRIDKRIVYLHRLIMSPPDGIPVDHIDGDKLNNRRRNLRICSYQENNFNRRGNVRRTSSQFKGVYRDRTGTGCWVANISFNHKMINLGRFKNEEDAARAYDEAARTMFGEFARVNFPEAQTTE